jgi:poly(3-hydroxybutyrate) depolymerase
MRIGWCTVAAVVALLPAACTASQTVGGATGGGGSGAGGPDPGSGGGTGSGGTTGAGGASASDGCSATTWPTASPQMINVTDNAGNTAARQFYFALPTGYAPSHAYPLVFAFHYLGGQASTIAGTGFTGRYYGIQPMFSDAIYVAPQGLADSGGQTGFPNTNDQDVAFTRAMVSWFQSNFCVDKARVMSTGFSYGGMMSHTIACEMPDVFRALGIMSGIFIGGARASCVSHGIASWITHGDADTTLPFASGESARDRILAQNHCGTTTHAVDPAPCVEYEACDAGYPVVWCPVAGEGHAIPPFGASAIARFFAQF